MTIKFGDLYDEMVTLEEAMDRMETDIENSECDSITKERLLLELEMLQQKYDLISNMEFDFQKLNFLDIIASIERCLDGVQFDSPDLSFIDHVYATAGSCGGSRQITLDDIEFINVYEISDAYAKHEANVYTFNKGALPAMFSSKGAENFTASYDSMHRGISIKWFATEKYGFGEISKVEVVLNSNAKALYGVSTVAACKVLLLTDVPVGHLEYTIDGDNTTFAEIGQTNKAVVDTVFQFFV